MATLAEYKLGSDIIHSFDFIDSDSNDILLSSLDGYGVAVYNPDGTLLGKWGINLTGFTADTAKFNASGTSEATLKITGGTYTQVGTYQGELYMAYEDTDFPDELRDLASTRNDIFIIRR